MSELLSNQADTCQTKLTKNAYPNFTKSQVSQIDYHDGIETLLLQHLSNLGVRPFRAQRNHKDLNFMPGMIFHNQFGLLLKDLGCEQING